MNNLRHPGKCEANISGRHPGKCEALIRDLVKWTRCRNKYGMTGNILLWGNLKKV